MNGQGLQTLKVKKMDSVDNEVDAQSEVLRLGAAAAVEVDA